MSLPPERNIDDEVQRLVDLVVAAVNPQQVVLFGSRSRGDHRAGSDIDLMVVIPDGEDAARVAKQLYSMRRPGLNIPVDYVVTTPSNFARYRDSIGLVYRQIAREGQEVYAA